MLPALLAGAALYGAFLWARRQLAQVVAARTCKEDGAADHATAPRDLGALELDPATGVYRPRHR
jgi:hypothetical protein